MRTMEPASRHGQGIQRNTIPEGSMVRHVRREAQSDVHVDVLGGSPH